MGTAGTGLESGAPTEVGVPGHVAVGVHKRRGSPSVWGKPFPYAHTHKKPTEKKHRYEKPYGIIESMHDRDFRRGRKRKEIKNVSREIMAENSANLRRKQISRYREESIPCFLPHRRILTR